VNNLYLLFYKIYILLIIQLFNSLLYKSYHLQKVYFLIFILLNLGPQGLDDLLAKTSRNNEKNVKYSRFQFHQHFMCMRG
jgi:hypothetical protein